MSQGNGPTGRQAYFIEATATPLVGDVAGGQLFDRTLPIPRGIMFDSAVALFRAAGTITTATDAGGITVSLLQSSATIGSTILFTKATIALDDDMAAVAWHLEGDLYVASAADGIVDCSLVFTVGLATPLIVPHFVRVSPLAFGEENTLAISVEYDTEDVDQVVTLDAFRYIVL